jgi:hypothetical protein
VFSILLVLISLSQGLEPLFRLVPRCFGFLVPRFKQRRSPVFMRVFKKTFRRLPCGFLRALSTAKAAFPQVFWVFCHFCLILGYFCGFSAGLAQTASTEGLAGSG